MSHGDFVRRLLADVAGVSLLLCAVIGAVLVGPPWTGGAIAVSAPVVAGVVVAVVLVRDSRRRDAEFPPGAECAHDRAPQFPAAASSNGRGPITSPPGRPARPDVVSAWVDYAWAVHHLAFHPSRVKGPGR